MKIVEYSDGYAKMVAEMWNKSNSNWGNSASVKTAEDVIRSESASGNIKLYLAIEDDLVVGYCSFSEYRGDERASYLPLLNVRPDYHGKKVGKKLILKVIEDAISSRWPRFDLYTWSGNIKAMPLYKKCGFFWEKKNNTVHLMNFIPYMYQTEALGEYLNLIDWYQDSKRVIDMDQDGELRGEFDMYRYDFENEETSLSLEFERRGRGLTMIDTPDYRIEVTLENQELVFGESYEVNYDVINKSGRQLDIEIKGKNNKNLSFDLNYKGEIKGKETIKGSVFVGEVKKDQEEGKTHPVVDADVYINGRHAEFRLGVNPKFPIKTKLVVPEYAMVLDREYTAYLELENNYNESKEISLKLSDSFVEFGEVKQVTLEAKEKKSVPVTYKLNDYGFYNDEVIVSVGSTTFKNRLKSIFNGHSNSFTAEMDEFYAIVSGTSSLIFEKDGKALVLVADLSGDAASAILPPEIGLPYTLELHNVEPEVTFLNDNEMDILFVSKEFPNTKVILHASNYNGIAKGYYELVNEGDEREFKLLCNVWQQLAQGVLPYKGKILDINGHDGSGLSDIHGDFVDENWLFERRFNIGTTWEKGMKVNNWKMAFETELTLLKKGESLCSPVITWSCIHKDYESFRKFAGYTDKVNKRGYLELNVNDGNPFFMDEYNVVLDNVRKNDVKGIKRINGFETDVFEDAVVSETELLVNMELEDRVMNVKKKMFKTKNEVNLQVVDGVHTVNNGVLEFKADQLYADSIYSLTKDGVEWLDSNYPTPKERVWWGSWVGGLNYEGSGLTDVVKQKEEHRVEFADVTDNFGNNWKGIKTSLRIEKELKLKGFTIENYYLTLPNVNVLMNVTKLINETGKVQVKRTFERVLAVKGDEVDTNTLMHINNQTFKCSNKSVEGLAEDFIKYSSTRKDSLHVYSPFNDRLLTETQEGFNVAWDIYKSTLSDDESIVLGNLFLVIDEDFDKEQIKDLANIVVEV